ncbi:hypothetical protein CISG_06823 [Coccidioides immitis RMSCC 3703]|uniref:Zn(2)-C6 fungal-type domain-containing protein n=2 Tax=Coccidioides immitis TaxID=5501 RepID=A0A0J8QZZ8_COCIT|nr:hypothetical protein CIRG_06886 [Coccidioides immitis RMSCC 2394]KMU78061.1 hypothetical protein CISG_06823 [Coccidioides immitis RMSCC 3703]
MSRESSGQPPVKRRRSKDGCRPCRIRKKKCDGRKPTCVSCERNVLLCSWFPNTAATDTSKDDAFETGLSLVSHSRKRKLSSCSSDDSASSEDHLFPTAWESEWHEHDPLPDFQDLDVLDIATLRQQPTLEPIFRSPISLLLYQHWVERTGDVMSAHRGKLNAFKTELPRLAIAYPDTVLQSLLACSGIHYCNAGRTPDIETSTWTHLGLALRSLKYGLTKLVANPGTDPIPLLATALVLCFVETTRGDVSGVLSQHLRAAHILFNVVLSSPSSLRIDESILEFLKEFYTYVLRITEISNDSQIIVLHGSVRQETPTGDFAWVSGKSYGMLVGCSYELFDMIPQVSALARRKRQRIKENSKQSSSSARSKHQEEPDTDEMAYRILRSRILFWRPPSDARQDFITCGWIYQQAILCYLDVSFANPPITAQTPLPRFIHERFERLKCLLDELPIDAPISHTLCWPLALFGSLARKADHRELILNRLQAMWELLRLGNINTTMNFLKRLWEDDGSDMSDNAASSSCDHPATTKNSSAMVRATKRKRAPKIISDNSDMEALMKKYELMFSFA